MLFVNKTKQMISKVYIDYIDRRKIVQLYIKIIISFHIYDE